VFDASCGTIRIQYDSRIVGARCLYESLAAILPNTQLPPPSPHPSLAMGARRTKRASLVFLATLAFTIPILIFAWAPLHHEKRMVYEHPSLALATVVQAIGLREFAPPAIRSLIHSKTLGMNLLITLSTTVAYVFSVVRKSPRCVELASYGRTLPMRSVLRHLWLSFPRPIFQRSHKLDASLAELC
jgi:cation transport ATPase